MNHRRHGEARGHRLFFFGDALAEASIHWRLGGS
jgi:hypothetical protein